MASRMEEEQEEEGEIEVFSDSDSAKSDGQEEADEDYHDGSDEEEGGGEDYLPSDQERKSQNVADLVRGNLVVKRQPLIPRILSVSEAAAIARKPFKPPCEKGYRDHNEELARRLLARKRFVPWGSEQPLTPISNLLPQLPVSSTGEDSLEKSEELPPGVEPLILWHSKESDKENSINVTMIVVDPLLVRFLRPHQREGVQFMFDCVSGLSGVEGISGCILADDMGLGKTLQSITLLYTLLRQGFDGKPIVKRALIVTPTSLVSNWEAEINKWLGGRVLLLALCESTRADVLSGIDSFLKPCSRFQVLIISYETFRMHSAKFERPDSCDLLICDEAHRLKNDQTLTNKALAALPCKRRILLSGTPMQNDLEEFYSMVNFTNPGILGDASYFRRYFEAPIISGREPTATSEEKKLGAERSSELSSNVNQFILRRTNTLLSNHLPPKIIEVVCCKLTPLQITLYKHFIQSKNVRRLISEDAKQSAILAYITNLKKLCNHPKTLDLFAQLCRERRYPFVRLDGTTSISKRQKLVNQFNDPSKDEFAFLLSSKAGGCGLNLIGGNRLVLFDPDWNPANDKQAAARVWRDGQKKRVYIYRFLSTGTIEEKVYQRQMSKEGLQKVIQQGNVDSEEKGNSLSREDLRDLFTFRDEIRSEIHENMKCPRCRDDNNTAEGDNSASDIITGSGDGDIGGFAQISGCLHEPKRYEKQVGTPLEEDLMSWGHHSNPSTVPDSILQSSAGDEISFVFTNQVDGKLVPVESIPKCTAEKPSAQLKMQRSSLPELPSMIGTMLCKYYECYGNGPVIVSSTRETSGAF
ncbi:putative DNA repair protein rhp54 [Carex littledalei]|uniref:Putative DNA repair protein rhp54 n=1 Tax=Carex littledalei TaxID=544730 RepID=A0A833QI36_9POAL|nr:putative DNA repair protein rhp54 [Carex littledalei]